MQITVTPEQAQHLARLVQQAQQADSQAKAVLALLTLGHAPADATLAAIDVQTGVLTLHVPDQLDAVAPV